MLQIDFLYEEGEKGSYSPVARNVVMDGITVENAPRVLNVRGFPSAKISDVRVNKSTFKGILQPDVIKDAEVKLTDCTLEQAVKNP